MTRGEKNNNPGNIDKGQGFQGEVLGTDERFATFSTPIFGIRALAKVLLTYYIKHSLNTVQGIINRWAPPVENDTGSYVNDVAKKVGVEPTAVIQVDDSYTLEKLVTAIIFHENGRCIYTEQQIEDGVEAAF